MKKLVQSFFQQLRRFTLYRKLVLSFMTLLAVFTVLIVTLLYTLFTHVMHQEYKYMAQNSLVSADSVLKNSYDKMSGVINEVLSLSNLATFFLHDQADRVNEANIFQELRRIKNLYPYIEKISLINISGERYLGTDGASDLVDRSLIERYEENSAGGMISFRRTVPENIRLTNSPSIEVTTFAFFPSGLYRNSVIVLDLKDGYFVDLMNPGAIHPQDQVLLITNEGVLIGKENIPEADWLSLFDDLEADNFRIMDFADTRCAVTARQACIPGWRLVRVMPMVGSGILTRRLSVQISFGLLAFLAAAVYVVWQMIRRIYTPVGTIVKEQVGSGETETVDEIGLICEELVKRSDEIETLTSRLNHSKPLFNSSWVKSQLLGDVETARRAEKLALEQGEIPSGSVCRCVAVLSVDRYGVYNTTVDVGERGLHDFAVSNILKELLGTYMLGELVRMDEQKMACLLACPSGELETEHLEALALLQKNFKEYFKHTISMGLGTPADTLEGTAESYRYACRALQYRFYRGLNSLNLYEGDWETHHVTYPVKEERDMLEAVLTLDEKALAKARQSFFQSLGTPEETRIKGYAERCINSLIAGLAIRSVIVAHGDIHGEVAAADTAEEVETLLGRWCEVMRERCEEEQKKERPGEGNPVLFAQNYINENYSEVDLSVEYLARMVDLSPAYFGKQFYNTLHVTCNDYIADVRLDHAAHLLRETSLPVQEISERVGVGSINYFYRLFKKKYGETPVSYRKKESNRKEE